LAFDTAAAVDLTQNWTAVSGNEVAPGIINLGGITFDPLYTIEPEHTGSIVRLFFTIRECAEGQQTVLCTEQLWDDFDGWATGCCGNFTCCARGNVNCDPQITPGDALCVFWRAILGEFQPECLCECSEQSADVNCDGEISPGDALCIFWKFILQEWQDGCQCLPTTMIKTQPAVSQILKGSLVAKEGIVQVPLIVEKPQNLDAFSLRLSYPLEGWDFIKVVPTQATRDWIILDGVEVRDGIISLGGFSTEPVASEGQVLIAELKFKAKTVYQDALSFELIDATDDLAGVPFRQSAVASFQVPKVYALHQNYPNPFNPRTEITFDLLESGKVILIVYNVLGQVMEVLIDSQMEAGSHAVRWNGEDASSGVYFYRLETEGLTATKKMVLLR